jgi:hypothetical protein
MTRSAGWRGTSFKLRIQVMRMVLLAGCAALLSCRPTAVPAPSVEGTTWAFCDGHSRVTFQSRGGLSMTGSTPVPASPEEAVKGPPFTGRSRPFQCAGRWTQAGNDVTFDCDGVTTYATEIDRDHMKGSWQRLPSETLRRGIPGYGDDFRVLVGESCSDGTCGSSISGAVPIEGSTCLTLAAHVDP